MFVAFFCLSYILFYFGCSLTGLLNTLRILRYSDTSVTFIAAPAIYLVFITLFSEGKRKGGRDYLFYVFPFLVACFFAVSNLTHFSPDAGFMAVLNFLSDFFFTLYFTLAVFYARNIHSRKEVTQILGFRIMFIFMILLLLNSLLMLSGHFFGKDVIYDISSVIYAVIVIFFGLLSPQLSPYILGKLPKVNVEKNLLNPVEIASLHKRLDTLMENKKLFMNPDLNLKSLASSAEVTPHQLSWFINSEFGLGFSVYINRFRLESVRKELLAKPEGTILEIAMANGFGSKTTFNSLFVSMYGVSPRDYRRMNGNIHNPE